MRPGVYVLNSRDAARFIGVAVRSLRDPAWRARRGLRAARIGRKLLWRVADLRRVIDDSLARGGQPR